MSDTIVNKIINSGISKYVTSDIISTDFNTDDGVQASFTYDNSSPYQGDTICFRSTSTGFITGNKWYVNGSLVSTATHFDYALTKYGANTIKLVVVGGEYTSSATASIYVSYGFYVNFTSETLVEGVPLTVSFTPTGDGCTEPCTFVWSYMIDTEWVVFSTLEAPEQIFTEEGYYDIRLDVTDALGIVATEIKYNYIVATELYASFTALPVEGDIPLLVSLVDTSMGVIDSYLWEISGDGVNWVEIGTTADVSYTFMFPSTYSVRLTITSGTETQTEIKYNHIQAGESVSGVQQENYTIDSTDLDASFDTTVTHTLNTLFITGVTVLDSDNEEVVVDFSVTDSSNIKISFMSTITGTYKVMIQGIQNYEI